MAYTALYRKFRPLTFSEMVGQEHITRTLRNQIKAQRVGHAYLFNGGRGTGKTSAAKILARAINCLNPQDGEPCNECEICKSMLEGSLTDVVEMDAASNNSVEDIRAIRDEVNFLPTIAKYRVYIIDEVHMLSTGAFNALLKTLEEPPEHVKFILATTEPQKLPATILSRCQRFDFKKISVADVIKRLEIICKESNIDIDENALRVIAVLSEGAMRDAISILERCIQDGETKITEDKVKELVGIPKIEYVNKIVKNIFEYDAQQAIFSIDEIIEDGKDLNNFLWEIIKYIKDILIYKSNGKLELYSDSEIEEIKILSEKVSVGRCLNLIYNLSELENNIKWSSNKMIMFQTGIIKACINVEEQGLEERVKILEDKVNKGIIVKQEVNKENTQNNMYPKQATNTRKTTSTIQTASKEKIEGKKQANYWRKVLDTLKSQGKMMLYTNLINTEAIEINDMTVGIVFLNGITGFGKTVLEKVENKMDLERLVSIECGKEMKIKYIEEEKKIETKENLSNKFNDLDIPINIIEG